MAIVEMTESQKVPFLLRFASGEKFSRSEKGRVVCTNLEGVTSNAAAIFFYAYSRQTVFSDFRIAALRSENGVDRPKDFLGYFAVSRA
jgi:hypothetical protein